MGRYYSGDIEGKFWTFQSSMTPEKFGCSSSNNIVNFYIDKENIVFCKKQINQLKYKLKDYLELLDDYFDCRNGYNEEEIKNYLEEKTGKKIKNINKIISWYADLELGEKILKCVKENGFCSFEAELE